MQRKTKEKELAIKLRKQGKTYSEILEQVSVSKSSLSLWLRSVGIAKRQKQRLTAKRCAAQKRATNTCKQNRIKSTERIIKSGIKDVGKMSKREIWLVGTALYWAEGHKAKPWNPSVGIDFANSDPNMINIFIRWLLEFCDVKREEIKIRLYIHENHRHRVEEARKHWMHYTELPIENFVYTYFKKHKPKTKRKNLENDRYFGLISVQVRRSTNLNRKIAGWTRGIIDNYCRVV